MTPGHRDIAQMASDGTALMLGAGIFCLLLITRPDSWRESFVQPSNTGPAGMEVSLLQAADTPPAPPPPVPRKALMHHPMQRREPAPDPPLPAELQNMPIESAVPEGGALVASGSAAAAPAVDTHSDLEAQYAAELRADIDRRTRPPDSAQYRLHPRPGEVRVGFIVMRNGEPKVVHVLRSSGSPILDDRAVTIVSAGHYPPMSAKIFAGEAEHAFAVTIEFRAPS